MNKNVRCKRWRDLSEWHNTNIFPLWLYVNGYIFERERVNDRKSSVFYLEIVCVIHCDWIWCGLLFSPLYGLGFIKWCGSPRFSNWFVISPHGVCMGSLFQVRWLMECVNIKLFFDLFVWFILFLSATFGCLLVYTLLWVVGVSCLAAVSSARCFFCAHWFLCGVVLFWQKSHSLTGRQSHRFLFWTLFRESVGTGALSLFLFWCRQKFIVCLLLVLRHHRNAVPCNEIDRSMNVSVWRNVTV